MAILSGYKKVKDRILTGEGWKLLSRWTSASTVEFNDGADAESKISDISTEISGIKTDVGKIKTDITNANNKIDGVLYVASFDASTGTLRTKSTK